MIGREFCASSLGSFENGGIDFPQSFLEALADSLAAVPVPLVDLRLLQTELLGKLSHLGLGPG